MHQTVFHKRSIFRGQHASGSYMTDLYFDNFVIKGKAVAKRRSGANQLYSHIKVTLSLFLKKKTDIPPFNYNLNSSPIH